MEQGQEVITASFHRNSQDLRVAHLFLELLHPHHHDTCHAGGANVPLLKSVK